jgi:D-3-phosphoglycerate dehydrogenase / 2-oxoglutarate reductase
MTDKRVLIGPSSFGNPDNTPITALQAGGFSVVPNPHGRKLTKAELEGLLPGVVGLIAGLETLDREVLERSDLKVISRCGAGMSNVDLDAAAALGIRVFSTPFGPTRAVAELTVCCLLALLRQVRLMDRDIRDGRWTKRVGRQLQGMCVLIIGYGRIGHLVGDLLVPFGVEIIVSDPAYVQIASAQPKQFDLVAALPRADVIILHTSGENCLLGVAEFELMKHGVFLLNAARGALVDEAALCRALDDGIVAGAWFDAFIAEPYFGRLTQYDQVLLTPHAASYTEEGRRQMELDAARNLITGFNEISRNG